MTNTSGEHWMQDRYQFYGSFRVLIRRLSVLLGFWLCFFLGSVESLAVPVAWDKPQANDQQAEPWLSLQSPHFQVFFRSDLETVAHRSLVLAERVYDDLVPFFTAADGHVSLPPQRTRMVLVDEFDVSNGWATPFPFAQIRLYLSPPHEVNSLESSDEWLHGLIRHEYVHILHSEMARSLPEATRHIVGRAPLLPFIVPLSPFPHALTPAMMLEGLAVYLETDKTLGYGRLQGSYYAMLMRTEVAAGELESLGEVAVAGRHWPTNRAYLYGAFFIEFLVEKYGESRLRAYLQNYSDELLAFFLQQSTARSVFGQSFNQLWTEFQHSLQQRFEPQIAQLRASDADAHTQLLAADIPSLPVFTSINNQLLMVRNNRRDRQALELLSASGAQVLSAEPGIRYLAANQDGQVLASRQLNYRSGRVLNDLFLWTSAAGWQRLTTEQRFRKARWLNTRQIIASRNRRGLSELYVLTLGEESHITQQTLIWRGEYGDVLADFAVNERHIVAAIKRPQQGWNLEQAALPTTFTALSISTASSTPTVQTQPPNPLRWKQLTHTRAVENTPEWLADGRILFSADYQGIFNIYALNPDTAELQQLTHTVTGVFNPQSVMLNGKPQLQYSRYSDSGYQLVQQPWQVVATTTLDGYKSQYDYPNPAAQTNIQSDAAKPYNVAASAFWSSIQPHSWLPFYQSNHDRHRLGVVSAGTDALGRYRYAAMLNRDSRQQQMNGQLLLQYDNRWSLGFERDHDTVSLAILNNGILSSDEAIQRGDRWSLARRFLWPSWQDQLTTHIGVVAERKQVLKHTLKRHETLTGVAFTFDNRQRFLDVAGVGWGSYLDLVLETNDWLASDYRGHIYQMGFQHTFDLPGTWALSYELAAGVADQRAQTFSLGGDQGEESRLFARNKYRLRGYDSRVQTGHHIHRQTLALQLPLARIDDNWNLNPLGLADISASLFVDTGSAWFAHRPRKQLTGIGIELTTEVVLGYRALLPVTLGYAKGLNRANGSTTQGYVSVSFAL